MNNRIIIVGGGIAGLSTAIALQQKRIEFCLVEAVPEIKALGSGLTLAGNAMRVLDQLGIAEQVKKRGQLLTTMIIQDKKGKTISLMDTKRLIREHKMYNVAIHRGELHDVLLSSLRKENILTGRRATGVIQDSHTVTVTFEDGTSINGSGLIVADGIHSVIRKQLVPGSRVRYSGYTCWRGLTKNQWQLTNKAYETWGDRGRFGYVPIGNDMVYWFACKNSPAQSETLKRYSIKNIADNFDRYPQPIREIILSTQDTDLIWNDINDLQPLQKFAFGRVLLLGDAAHATTPNLGQGACLAIEDASVAAEEISGLPNDIRQAFINYESRRLARAHYIVNTSYRMGKIAQVENRFVAGLRNALLRMVPDSLNEKQMEQILDLP